MRILFPLFFILCLLGGIFSFKYTVEKCGWERAFFLGKHGAAYAAMGFCDKGN